MITHRNSLDICPGGVPLFIRLSQYDSSFTLIFDLFSHKGSFTVESGTTARFRELKPDGNAISIDATISGTTVTLAPSQANAQQITAIAGNCKCELSLFKGDKELNTANFTLLIEKAVIDKDTPYSDSVIRELIDVTDRADEILEAAETVDAAIADLPNLIDKTLTLDNHAADAKAVGDILLNVTESSSGDETIIASEAEDSFIKNGFLFQNSNATGYSDNNTTRTIFIPCEPNSIYTFNRSVMASRFRVAYITGTQESVVHNSTVYNFANKDSVSSFQYETGANATYLGIYFYQTSDTYSINQILDGFTITGPFGHLIYTAVDDVARSAIDKIIDDLPKHPYFGNSVLATLVCQDDLSTEHTYYWGEEVAGSANTPFVQIDACYNGSMSQADYRIVTYEDGSPIIENGKIYFTMSTQIGHGSPGEIICEYDLDTCNIRIVGCHISYYDNVKFSATGNMMMYNRQTKTWLLGTHTDGNHGHTLVIAKSISDPRFGIHDIFYDDLDYANPGSGDEDQFIFYSSEISKWVMVYVAIRNNDANYILRMHVSDYPDRGFTFYKEINDSSVLRATGVTSVIVGGTRYVLSGSSATGTNKFLVYSFPNLTYVGELNLDFTPGARNGIWSTLFPITDGIKTKYFFFTFDRSPAITSNVWSYGGMYLYCASEMNDGMEYPIVRDGVTIYEPIDPTYSITQLHFIRRWAFKMPMDFKLELSKIKLDEYVLSDQSNLYPLIGSTDLTQNEKGLFLNAQGSAIIVGGEHRCFASYLLTNYNMDGSDKRSLVFINNQNNVVAKVSVTKDGTIYGFNGSSESVIGQMRTDCHELIICPSWATIYIYQKQ